MKLPTTAAIDIELARKSLAEFTKAMWPVLNPGTPLEWNWHHDCIADHVQALLTGTLGKQNLIINICPGSMKSSIVSVAAPAWMWLQRPAWSGIFASAADNVRTRDSDKCRLVLDSPWYRHSFKPTWRMRRGQDTKLLYKNTEHGFRQAVTIGQEIMGDRADSLFADDANSPNDLSKVKFDEVRTWWRDKYWRRLNHMSKGTRLVVMQRVATLDLTQYIMDTVPEQTEFVCIPLLWEESQRRMTSLGWTDPRKTEGEVMHPARFTEEVIRTERDVVLGERGFNSQYQQRPVNPLGEIFRRGFVNFVNPNHIPPAMISQRLLSADTAIKEGEENDYSVLLEGWEFDRGVMLRSCLRQKMAYPALKEASILKAQQVQPSAFLIEDKASGQQVIQELTQHTSLPVVAIQVNKDKTARGWPIVPYWEAGRVFFPCDDEGNVEEWVPGFLEEIYGFPKTPDGHDDRYDAMVQLLTHVVLAPGARGLLEFYAAQKAQELAATAEQRKMDAIHHPVETIRLGGA